MGVNGELTTSDRECMAFNAGPGPPIQMSANEQGLDGLIYLCFTFLVGVPIVNCMIPIVIKGGKARKNDNNTYRYDTKCVGKLMQNLSHMVDVEAVQIGQITIAK